MLVHRLRSRLAQNLFKYILSLLIEGSLLTNTSYTSILYTQTQIEITTAATLFHSPRLLCAVCLMHIVKQTSSVIFKIQYSITFKVDFNRLKMARTKPATVITLSETIIQDIIKLKSKSKRITMKKIAKKFNVDRRQVKLVIDRENQQWKKTSCCRRCCPFQKHKIVITKIMSPEKILRKMIAILSIIRKAKKSKRKMSKRFLILIAR